MPFDPLIISKQAATLYAQGNNCAQSVSAALLGALGSDPVIAFSGLAPFGGGICSRQLTCGAVTGALFALGLATGRSGDSSAAYAISKEFCNRFEKEQGSLSCRELLDAAMTTEADTAAVQLSGRLTTPCWELVRAAAALAAILLNDLP